jgi:predicted transcriptional regulator
MPARRASSDPTTTVRIPCELCDALANIAKKHHWPTKAEATWALEQYVEAYQHLVDAEQQQVTS